MDYQKHISEYFGISVDFSLDDQIHRFGKKKEFWAVGRSWDYKGNTYWQVKYGNWKDASSEKNYRTLSSWDGNQVTREESNQIRKQTREINSKITLEKEEKYKNARDLWAPIFKSLPKESDLHEYCEYKGLDNNYSARVSNITDSSVHVYPGTLCVPVYNANKKIAGVQRIFKNKEGQFEKRYCTGLELRGSFCPIGKISTSDIVYVAEGFATGASIHMATNKPVLVCFQAGNILPAINSLRKFNPKCKIIICADKDESVPSTDRSFKIGEKKAFYAAKKTKDCIVKVVEFPEGSPSHWSDFNDAHQFVNDGLNYIKSQLEINLDRFEEEEFRKDINRGFTEPDDNDKPRRQYHKLLSFLGKKHNVKYITDQKTIVIYNGTHYESVSDNYIKAFAQKYFNFPMCESEKERMEFLSLVKASFPIKSDFFKYEQTEGLINLRNGVYNYKEDKLFEHSPEYGFQNVIPVNHNPEADCPTWDQLMKNVLDNREHLQSAIEEFMGLIISNMDYNKFNKALILDGSGSNGKSTVIRAISDLCGEANCSSISMAEIPQNRFLISNMTGKLVNFSEEEPKKIFSESGYFKKLTGGSPLYAEEKGKKGFTFKNRTKLVLSYNEVPYLPDNTIGMKRRLLIIPFDVNLEKRPDLMIEGVHEKLQGELEGMLNRAIGGLKRLIEHKKFTKVIESDSRIERMVVESDSVQGWFKECVQYTGDSEDRVSSEKLYQSYLDYVGGYTKVQKRGLGIKLKKILESLECDFEHKKFKIQGTNTSIWGFTCIALEESI